MEIRPRQVAGCTMGTLEIPRSVKMKGGREGGRRGREEGLNPTGLMISLISRLPSHKKEEEKKKKKRERASDQQQEEKGVGT